MEKKSVKDLAMRMGEIRKEFTALTIEYNSIIEELWRRMPQLKDNEDIQKEDGVIPKVYRRVK